MTGVPCRAILLDWPDAAASVICTPWLAIRPSGQERGIADSLDRPGIRTAEQRRAARPELKPLTDQPLSANKAGKSGSRGLATGVSVRYSRFAEWFVDPQQAQWRCSSLT
jgi:hypothetical protein